jgi:hypothetical protein
MSILKVLIPVLAAVGSTLGPLSSSLNDFSLITTRRTCCSIPSASEMSISDNSFQLPGYLVFTKLQLSLTDS